MQLPLPYPQSTLWVLVDIKTTTDIMKMWDNNQIYNKLILSFTIVVCVLLCPVIGDSLPSSPFLCRSSVSVRSSWLRGRWSMLILPVMSFPMEWPLRRRLVDVNQSCSRLMECCIINQELFHVYFWYCRTAGSSNQWRPVGDLCVKDGEWVM